MEYLLKGSKPRDTESLKGKVFALLGLQRAYVPSHASVGVHEEEGVLIDAPLDYSHYRQTKTALLEAECRNAKALMETERQRLRMI